MSNHWVYVSDYELGRVDVDPTFLADVKRNDPELASHISHDVWKMSDMLYEHLVVKNDDISDSERYEERALWDELDMLVMQGCKLIGVIF